MCESNETIKLFFIFTWKDQQSGCGGPVVMHHRLMAIAYQGDARLLVGTVAVASHCEHTDGQDQNSFGFTYFYVSTVLLYKIWYASL